MTTLDEDRLATLMVKTIDDVATAKERDELMRHLHQHPDLLAEYEAHLGLRFTFDNLRDRIAHDDAIDLERARPERQLQERIGTTLVLGGGTFTAGMGLMQVLLDENVPLWLRLGVSFMLAGGSLLLHAAWRTRQRLQRTDPYNEVVR